MKVITLNLGEEPKLVEIESGYKKLQELVGGIFQFVPITFKEKPYYLVLNEEGKIIGLPANRRIYFDGELRDIMVGDGLLVHVDEGKDLDVNDLEYVNQFITKDSLFLS